MNLTDLEKEALTILADNETLLAAVIKVFHYAIESRKQTITISENNMVIGEKYRAYLEAKELLEDSFNALKSFQTIKQNKGQPNRAK